MLQYVYDALSLIRLISHWFYNVFEAPSRENIYFLDKNAKVIVDVPRARREPAAITSLSQPAATPSGDSFSSHFRRL